MTECIISGTIDDGIPYTSAGQLMPNTEAMIIDVSSGKELDYNEVSICGESRTLFSRTKTNF